MRSVFLLFSVLTIIISFTYESYGAQTPEARRPDTSTALSPSEARGKLEAARNQFVKALKSSKSKTAKERGALAKSTLAPATSEMNKALQNKAAENYNNAIKRLSAKDDDKKAGADKAPGPPGSEKDKDKKGKPTKKEEIVLDGSKVPKEIEFKKQVGKLPASTPAAPGAIPPTTKDQPRLKPSHSGEGVTEIEFK